MESKIKKLSKISAVAILVLTLPTFFIACASNMATTKTETVPESEALKLITDINTVDESESFNVLIAANRLLTYTSVKQLSPLGVILYFPETVLDNIQTKYIIDNDTIDIIEASEQTERGHATRLEILLKKDVTYSVARENDGIKISFEKPVEMAELEKPVIETPDETKAETPNKTEEKIEKELDLSSLPAATRLESIYATQTENSVTIKIMADGVIRDYKTFTLVNSPARIVYDIFNLKSPQQQKKEQLVPVNTKWVKSVRHFGYPDKLRLVLDTSKPYIASYSATPAENGLLIHVGSDEVMAAPAVNEIPETVRMQPETELSSGEAKPDEPAEEPAAPERETFETARMQPETELSSGEAKPDEPAEEPAAPERETFETTRMQPETELSSGEAKPDEPAEALAALESETPETVRMQAKAELSSGEAKPDEPVIKAFAVQESETPETSRMLAQAGPPAGEPKPDEPAEEPAAPNVEKDEPQRPAWVNRIDFSSEDAGRSTLIIGTTRPVQYDLQKAAEKRLQLKLFDAKLPDYRKRPLITTRFQSAVDRILPFEAPALKDTSLFAIELRETVPYYVEQTDNLLLVHFEASSIPPKPLDTAKLPPWKTVMAQAVTAPETPATIAEMPAAQESTVTVAEPVTGTIKVYTGEKIALDFFDTDIKNVFRILREVSRKNFAIDKGVAGKVTLTLEKPVPWDQVLDLILKMNGLGMTYEGDIIRIAKRATLVKEEKEARAKLAAERKAQRAEQKEVKALEPLVTEYISVNYANAKSEVLPKVRPVLTAGRGKISVDDRNNQLIITDVADTIEQIREIVKRIDQVTPQVLIEARIVEATNRFSRGIGVQWGITGGPNQTLTDHLGGDLTYNLSATNPSAAPLGLIGINFTRLAGTPFSLLNAQLSASESEGDLNIISAPKVLTLNNKKATIKQGVKYPYNKLVDGETRTEFINVDLLLEVEPLVTPDQRIAMKLKVTNNELGAVVNGQQSFTTKEAETELLVNDGETIVIGGIRKITKRNDVLGVPVFKDIPVLGWLFKSNTITDDKEELLIFITPRIVQLEQRD